MYGHIIVSSDPVLPDEPSLALDSPDFAERIAARAKERLAQQNGVETPTPAPAAAESRQAGVAHFGAGPDAPASVAPSAATVEVPTVEAPVVEAPTVDPPTVDPSAVEAPAVDAPNIEVPNADLPNADPTPGEPVAKVAPAPAETIRAETKLPEADTAATVPLNGAVDDMVNGSVNGTVNGTANAPQSRNPDTLWSEAPEVDTRPAEAPRPQVAPSSAAAVASAPSAAAVATQPSASDGPTNAAAPGPVDGAAPGEPLATRPEDDYDVINPRLRSLIEWAVVVAGALAVALVIKTFLLQAYFIPSPSMEATLVEDDRVLVNKLSKAANRGDVMVFKREVVNPADPEDLIKRVIALEGETIEARDGTVFIDGQMLQEPYVENGIATFGPVWTEVCTNERGDGNSCTVPDGGLFMMGDNRQNSRDSRFFGPIQRDQLVGRAFIKVWPLGDIEAL